MKDFHPVLSSQQIAQEEAKPELAESGFIDLVKAHWKTDITSKLIGFSEEDIQYGGQPDYDFRLKEEDVEGYENYANAFMDVTSRRQLDAYKARIDDIRLHEKVISEHGWVANFATSAITGMGDPAMAALIPFGGIAGTVGRNLLETAGIKAIAEKTIGTAALKGVTGTIAKGAVMHGAIGAGIGAAAVASAGAMGADVDPKDIVKGLGHGFLLGSFLGGLGAGLGKINLNQAKSATKGFYDSLTVPAEKAIPPTYEKTFIPISELDKGLIENTKFIESKVSESIPISGMDPTTALQTSPFPKSKQLASLLTDTFLKFVDKEGVPIISEANVESSAGVLYATAMTKSQRMIKGSFKSYRNRLKAEKTETALGKVEFNEAVGRAVRNYSESPIPEVKEAAKFYTEEITKQSDLLMKNDVYGYKSGKIKHLEGKSGTLSAEIEGFKKPYEENLESLNKKLIKSKEEVTKFKGELEEAKGILETKKATPEEISLHKSAASKIKVKEEALTEAKEELKAKGIPKYETATPEEISSYKNAASKVRAREEALTEAKGKFEETKGILETKKATPEEISSYESAANEVIKSEETITEAKEELKAAGEILKSKKVTKREIHSHESATNKIIKSEKGLTEAKKELREAKEILKHETVTPEEISLHESMTNEVRAREEALTEAKIELRETEILEPKKATKREKRLHRSAADKARKDEKALNLFKKKLEAAEETLKQKKVTTAQIRSHKRKIAEFRAREEALTEAKIELRETGEALEAKKVTTEEISSYESAASKLIKNERGLTKFKGELRKTEETLKLKKVTTAQIRSHGIKIAEFRAREKAAESIQSNIRTATNRYEKKVAGRKVKIEALSKDIEATKAKTYTSKDFKDMGLNESYLTAIYDKGWISANEKLAVDRLINGFMEHHKLDAETAMIAAESTIDQILGEPVGRMTTNILERGPLKERKLLIPAKYLKEAMVDNISVIYDRFMKTTTTDNRLFELFGTLNVEDVIAQVEKEYKTIRKYTETEKDMNFLRLQYSKDAENVRTIWNRLRGLQGLDSHSLLRKHPTISAVSNIVLNATSVRAMGALPLTMLQDIGQIMSTVGLKRFFGSSFNLLKDPRKFKKIKADPWLNALKLERGTRQTPLAQASVGGNFLSRLDRMSSQISDTFFKTTFIHQLDDLTKFLSGYATSENALKIMEQSLSGKAISKSDTSFMGSIGIGKKWFKPIVEQFKKHGEVDKGTYAPNIDLWENRDAKLVFGSAIRKTQNQAVLTPGVGTLPAAFDNPFLAPILQFRSFAFSSYQKALIPALEKKDLNVFMGFITMSSMGIFKNWLLCAIDGKEFDPEKAIKRSIEANDMMAWLPDMYGVLDTLFHFDPKVGHSYASLLDVIGGAPGSTLKEASITGGMAGKMIHGEPVTKTQIRSARRLIPWQNHIVLRGIFNKIEDAQIEKFAKKKSSFK